MAGIPNYEQGELAKARQTSTFSAFLDAISPNSEATRKIRLLDWPRRVVEEKARQLSLALDKEGSMPTDEEWDEIVEIIYRQPDVNLGELENRSQGRAELKDCLKMDAQQEFIELARGLSVLLPNVYFPPVVAEPASLAPTPVQE